MSEPMSTKYLIKIKGSKITPHGYTSYTVERDIVEEMTLNIDSSLSDIIVSGLINRAVKSLCDKHRGHKDDHSVIKIDTISVTKPDYCDHPSCGQDRSISVTKPDYCEHPSCGQDRYSR